MADDWAAVAKVINQRIGELGIGQRELAERARVSQATVREIQHDTVQRNRSERTLESLSTALGLHPDHLKSVLHKERPPEPDPLVARIDALEAQLTEITTRLDELKAGLTTVIRHFRTRRD